jgi:hypothetical protein
MDEFFANLAADLPFYLVIIIVAAVCAWIASMFCED